MKFDKPATRFQRPSAATSKPIKREKFSVWLELYDVGWAGKLARTKKKKTQKKKKSPRGRQTEKYPVISDHHVENNKQALPASSCPKARQRDKWREYHKLLCEGKSCFLPWMLKGDMLLTARRTKKN